jgi:CBS domain-containing protein
MHKMVRDVMTRKVVTVRADAPFKKVAEILVKNRVSAVPVLDGKGHVLGVISEADLLEKEEFREQFFDENYHPALLARRSRQTRQDTRTERRELGETAADIMTTPGIAVRPQTNIVIAARAMSRHKVKRLLVVDEEGRLEGIVSRHDLLNVFVRTDDDIAGEVRNDILEGPLWTSTAGVHLSVFEGVVTLSGQIAHRSDAEIIARIIARVNGVVDVVDKWVGTGDDAAEPGGKRT